MGRMGRPIIGEAKNQNIKARIDGTLLNELYQYCDSEGFSVSDVIRMSLREFLLKQR